MEQAEIKALAAAVPSHLWGQPVQRLWEAKGHLDAGGTGHLWPCRPSCRPSNTPVCSPLPAFAFTVSRPHVTGSSQGHLLPRAGLTISSRPAHSPPQRALPRQRQRLNPSSLRVLVSWLGYQLLHKAFHHPIQLYTLPQLSPCLPELPSSLRRSLDIC